jgi:hypothetical protein
MLSNAPTIASSTTYRAAPFASGIDLVRRAGVTLRNYTFSFDILAAMFRTGRAAWLLDSQRRRSD